MVENNQRTISMARPMYRPIAAAPERDSIFGDTYDGVPSPFIAHRHPYPTRHHGMSLTVPQQGHTYQPASYAVAPFLGVDDEPVLGLGAWRRPFLGRTLDTVVGALFGYAAAPTAGAAIPHAIAAGVVAWAGGALGIVAVLTAEVILNQRQAGLRPDMRALRGGI